MKQETHIINWILIGLISISIVLYIYYDTPFMNSKTLYNNNIESFVEGDEAGDGKDGAGEGGDGGDAGEGGEAGYGDGDEAEAGAGEAGAVENNTVNIRDSIKSILSLRQIDSENDQNDGIMNNMIILTRKINDPINDIIGGYDIEAEIDKRHIPIKISLQYMHKSKNPQLLGRNMQLANAITNKIDEIKAFISSNQTTQQASPPTILTSSPPIPINDDSRNLADNINDQLNNDPFYLVYLDDTKQYKQIYIQKTANTYKYSIDNNTYNIIYNIDYKITDVGKEKNLQYILEINTVNKTNIDLLKEATGNENIREFISKIRMIGSDSRDYTLVNRDDDYYLNMTNGVSIDIKFTDNYINNFSAEINTDTSVNELLPTNFGGTDEDKKGYKAYKFKTATIYVIKDTDTHAITIDYYKETNVSDIYLDILNKGISSLNKCKKIFATQNIIITLILKSGTLNKSINDETFKGLIEKIDIPASELSYKLGFKYIKENGQEIIPTNGIYKVDLYIENITFKTQSMNLWLENAINNINTETLDNQLDEIITPMFDMDNEIDKRDKIVKRVRDIYRFNKLSNSQNNMRFYNSHY